MREITVSLEDIRQVVSILDEMLPNDAVVFLRGDLASGKTTLTQEIARYYGVEEAVTSPTFSLQQCYVSQEGKALYHYDLYRLDHDEFMAMGLFEEFEKPGWHLVEWGSDALKAFLEGVGYNLFIVEITPDQNGRCYRIGT